MTARVDVTRRNFQIEFIAFMLLMLLISRNSAAQYGLYFFAGTGVNGSNYRYRAQQQGDVLKKGWMDPDGSPILGFDLSFTTGLYFRHSRKFAFEAGLAINEIDFSVHDATYQKTHKIVTQIKDTYSANQASDGNFDFAHVYRAPYLSFYYFPGGKNFYINPGIEMNFNGQSRDDYNLTTTSGDGQVLTMRTHFASHYTTEFLEAGFNFNGPDNRVFNDQKQHRSNYFLGVRYTQAGQIMSSDYQNTTMGSTAYTDHMTASGSYLSVTFRMGMQLKSIPDRSPAEIAAARQARRERIAGEKSAKLAQAETRRMLKSKERSDKALKKSNRLKDKNQVEISPTKARAHKTNLPKPIRVHVKRTKKAIRSPRFRH